MSLSIDNWKYLFAEAFVGVLVAEHEIVDLVNRLDEETRICIIRYFDLRHTGEHPTFEDLGEELGISSAVVEAHIERGVREIRQTLHREMKPRKVHVPYLIDKSDELSDFDRARLLQMDLEEAGIPARVALRLREHPRGLRTLEQLVQQEPEELKRIAKLNSENLDEIKRRLNEMGLELGMSLP